MNFKITILISVLLMSYIPIHAQEIDYIAKMDDIMEYYLDDYPKPSIDSLNMLFQGVDIETMSPVVQVYYNYNMGYLYSSTDIEKSIQCFSKVIQISENTYDIGIRNTIYLESKLNLADNLISRGSKEDVALATCYYSDVLNIGLSLLKVKGVYQLVLSSLIKNAEIGTIIWEENWVKKMWLQARDLALESKDESLYTLYFIKVCRYYCDHEDYATAHYFLNDAINKNVSLLKVNAQQWDEYLRTLQSATEKTEMIVKSKGISSLEYWANQLEIASISFLLCSPDESISKLVDVEDGLKSNNLTESYEYAQTLHLLSNFDSPIMERNEIYYKAQVQILVETPKYFIYTTDVEAYNSLGVCQMKNGKYKDAINNYEKALAYLKQHQDPEEGSACKTVYGIILHNLGRCQYLIGDYQSSIKSLTKSIQIQKDCNGSSMLKTEIYLQETSDKLK